MSLHQLAHDHSTLTRAVDELEAMHGREPHDAFVAKLDGLLQDLFEHFAREEEGLFPFLLEHVPDQAAAVAEMQAAHDAICGSASRILSLDPGRSDLAVSLFRRFHADYTAHSEREADFLRSLAARLSPEQQRQLAEILARL